MANTIVLSSTFPCEIGAAAVYHCLDKDSCVVLMSIAEAKSFDKTVDAVTKCNLMPKTIVMIGTYWKDELQNLLGRFGSTTFYLYCFGECLNVEAPNLRQFSGASGVGPTKYLIDLVLDKYGNSSLFNLFINNFSVVFKFIDDRIYNRNIVDNQIFYTGLFNYDNDQATITLFEKFMNLLEGRYDLHDIIETGRVITSAQMGMARERAKNNAKKITLKNGESAVVSEACDLINLTHDALHMEYPECQVSVLLYMRFGKQDQLAYSVRSFDEAIDASTYGKTVNGDGNKTAAGGRVNHEFPIPF
ncbi:putative ORFan [Tupanvirus deep ocean]|uniref:ORFan n=2 Tax=Tupanvirus TaxID=2094720 RepID=A0AC62A8S9_9VIRU|nr:putative ORFan [Tupanvirus deep ocean]QKU34157.1 putative ORFan [Tupanvirus deep ocean]